MDELNTQKGLRSDGVSITEYLLPVASLYKSLKHGWHWRWLRWAVVAASEAAQGHEANGLPSGSREFKTLFDEVVRKVQVYSTESGDPLDTLEARLPTLCALERLAYPALIVPRNKAGLTVGILNAAGLPAMQFRNCRDAFYRTQMESPQNSDPDRFRIRFREPQDLMTVKAEELAGAAVRIHTRQRTPHTRRPIRGCTFLRSLPHH